MLCTTVGRLAFNMSQDQVPPPTPRRVRAASGTTVKNRWIEDSLDVCDNKGDLEAMGRV